MNTGGDPLTRALAFWGGVLAISLFVFQIVTVVRYGVSTYAMVVTEQARRRRWSKLSLDRLQYRLSYHPKRFSTHAPYWQVRHRRSPTKSVHTDPRQVGVDVTFARFPAPHTVTAVHHTVAPSCSDFPAHTHNDGDVPRSLSSGCGN